MCGACGSIEAGWPERIAPLNPGSGPRRARALTALLRAKSPGANSRITVTTWPGGGVRWHSPHGWNFARSLLEAAGALTRHFGPLVPAPEIISPSESARPLAFPVTAEATAVWCTAAVQAGWASQFPCTLNVQTRTIVLHQGQAHLYDSNHTRPTVQAAFETSELAAHWARTLSDFKI
jgi:hypothetical protein